MEEGCRLDVKKFVKKSVAILPARTMMGGESLRDLRRQKEVIIPEGTQEIGEQWFMNSKIETVVIPASVKTIKKMAFCGCERLKQVTFAEGSKLEMFGEYAFYDSALESIRIPPAVKRIEARVFAGCRNLRDVEVPSGLEYIGKCCFVLSGIEEITLPSTPKEIGEDVFKYCKNLRVVWVENGCVLDIRKYVDDGVEVRQK